MICKNQTTHRSVFSPHHLVDDADVGLDELHDLGGDVLVRVVWDRGAVVAVLHQFDRRVNRLKKAVLVYAGEDEAGLVEGFGALRARADADGWERMAHAREERGLLRKRAAVAHYGEGVHLEAVVVVEAERLVLNHAGVEPEAGLRETVAAARVAAVENRHVVLRGHRVDGVEQAQEVLLRVDVLLAVGAQEDVPAFLEAETTVDVTRLYLREVAVKDLRHRGTGHVGAFLRQTAVGKVAPGMLAVGHVHVADDVHYPAVRLLRKALVLAAVARLHVEYRDVKALRTDYAQAGVRVAEDEDGVRPGLGKELVGAVDDVTAGRPEVIAYRVHIDLRLGELEVAEEDAVEVVVVVLPGVGENHVEILAALRDHRRKADNLRARADDNDQLELAVILEFYVRVVELWCLFHFSSVLFLNRVEIGVRTGGVEDLVCPYHSHKIFGLREIDDVVGVAREHVNDLKVVAAHLKLNHRERLAV